METLFTRSLVAAAILVALSGPVGAQQPAADDCTKMLARIMAEAEYRLDDASHAAKLKAQQIAQLCKSGQVAEAEKLAKETMATLGLK
jgi:hypothetical protein